MFEEASRRPSRPPNCDAGDRLSDYAEDAIPLHPSEFSCIDLVNSAFSDYLGSDTHTDRLGSTEWWRWFLDRYDLTPDTGARPPIEEVGALRGALRRVLEKWAQD